jgi:flagellar M-ring protein FliF
MVGLEQAQRLKANLLKLGSRRLVALAVIGATVFVVTGFAGFFLSRPTLEPLYSGLDRQDVGRIAAVLKEAAIPFDVTPGGDTVLVRFGDTARARMLLAEKGLPNSPNAGNELFDKLGSLGLTSFMQEVTRVRALEGELARTIQLMRGVKAARVHVVMPDQGSFRRNRQPPSASVVVRSETVDDQAMAKTIRHLVAAAVPGMTLDAVTVLSADGVLLASGNDQADTAPGGMLALEKTVSREILENVRKTLTPYLGLRNFQVSVAARVNTDKKQTNETIYDPDSRVERSVRVTKQNQTSQNSASQAPATVERNLPQQDLKPGEDSKQTNEESQKREELTNYELSSKTISTVSGGYAIETLSVALLVNRASLTASLGAHPTPEAVERQLTELEQLVTSAAGARKERGDTIKISAVEFLDGDKELEPQPPIPLAETLLRQSGTVLNALTVLVVALLLIWFGVRPATRALLGTRDSSVTTQDDVVPALEQFTGLGGLDGPPQLGGWGGDDNSSLLEDLTRKPRRSPQRRLEQIVELDEELAAAVLRQWMRAGDLV